MNNTVEFDPGIGNFVINFNEYINDIYSNLYFLKTIHQKKAKFKLIYKQIENAINNNICFYEGCMLWAHLITAKNKDNPKEIKGNVFLNLPKEELENYDYLIQVNFLESFFNSFEKDMLYYLGIKYEIPQEQKEILKIYKEFLTLNKGFINTKTTADIVLPEKIRNLKPDFDVEKLIFSAIEKENLLILGENFKLVQTA